MIDFSELTDLDAVYVAIGRKYVELVTGQRSVEFAARGSGTKKTAKPNCTPGKSFSCGYSCQSIKRQCQSPLPGQTANYADWMAAQATNSTTSKQTAAPASKKSKPTLAPTPASTSAATPKAPAAPKEPTKSNRKPESAVPVSALSSSQPQRSQFSYVGAPSSDAEVRKLQKEMLEAKKFGNKAYAKDPATYVDNVGIFGMVGRDLSDNPAGFRAVRDEKGVLQAVASVRVAKNAIEIEYLATSPWNIKPGDKRYTKGAGTAAIEQIVEESIRLGKGGRVELESLPGAVTFYQKIGFTPHPSKPGYFQLTPGAAQEFLTKRQAARNQAASTPQSSPQPTKAATPTKSKARTKAEDLPPPQSVNGRTVFSAAEPPTRKADAKKLQNEILRGERQAEKLYKSDRLTYGDAYGIYKSTRAEVSLDPATFRGVRDSNGTLQAFASVQEKDKAIKIEYLVSSPWNVKPGDARYTRGAGSAVIEQVVVESIRKGKEGRVVLEALPGAVDFYKKIGFKDKGQAKGYNTGVRAMELDANAARAFLAKRGVTDFAEGGEESAEDYNRELEDLEIAAGGAFTGKYDEADLEIDDEDEA